MGVSYYAAVVFGVPVERRRQKTTVTRYHEVTGEPYQKQDYTTREFIQSTDIEFPMSFEDPRVNDDNWDDLMDEQVYFPTEGVGYFGHALATVDPQDDEVRNLPRGADAVVDMQDAYWQAVDRFTSDPEFNALLKKKGKLFLIGFGH